MESCIKSLLNRHEVNPDDLRTVLATHFCLPEYTFHEIIQRLVRRPLPSFVDDIRAGLRKQP